MTEPRLVLCTAPEQEALGLARTIVGERLAACVNVIPRVTSVYIWEGEVCEDGEVLLVIKTTDEAVAALSDRLVALHTYDVPEVVSLPIAPTEGNAKYLTWLMNSVDPRHVAGE